MTKEVAPQRKILGRVRPAFQILRFRFNFVSFLEFNVQESFLLLGCILSKNHATKLNKYASPLITTSPSGSFVMLCIAEEKTEEESDNDRSRTTAKKKKKKRKKTEPRNTECTHCETSMLQRRLFCASGSFGFTYPHETAPHFAVERDSVSGGGHYLRRSM